MKLLLVQNKDVESGPGTEHKELYIIGNLDDPSRWLQMNTSYSYEVVAVVQLDGDVPGEWVGRSFSEYVV